MNGGIFNMVIEKLPFAESLPEMEIALNGVIKAGEAILEVYGKDFLVMMKGNDDPLTEADLKSNWILKEALSKTNYLILSEEDTDDQERLNHSKIWIIDPLDGTKEFVERNGEFSILVALVEKGIPTLGIVYQPTIGLLYVAQKGQGVYERTKEGWVKLSASRIDKLFKSTAVVSRSHLSEHDRSFLDYLNVNQFFQKGSAGLKAGEICAGKAEFYFNSSAGLKQWDTCAVCCMINEVGGKITDMFGNDLRYNVSEVVHTKGVLISNGEIHDKLIEGYQEFLKK